MGRSCIRQLGRITHPIDLPYLGFPQFGEMLFLQLQLLGGQTPSVLHWLFAVLTTVILVAGEARRLWREPIGWAAAAIFLSAETVILEAGWPYIDLMLAFCVLAAYVCLRRGETIDAPAQSDVWQRSSPALPWRRNTAPRRWPWRLRCLFSGAARLRVSGQSLVFGFVAGLVALPWYLKSWVLLGNPFYPFVFGGLYWDSLRSELFNRFGSGLLTTAPLQLIDRAVGCDHLGRRRQTGLCCNDRAVVLAADAADAAGMAHVRSVAAHPPDRSTHRHRIGLRIVAIWSG